MNLIVFSIAILGVLLNAAAQLALKWGVNINGGLDKERELIDLLYWVITNKGILIGLVLYAVSVVIWVYILSKLDVGVAYPLLSIGYVVNVFMASWIFNESLTAYKFIGIGLIIMGVIVLYKGAQS